MRRRVPTPHGPKGPPLPCHDPPHTGRIRLLSCRDVTHPGHSAASWRPRREKLRGLQERVLLLLEGHGGHHGSDPPGLAAPLRAGSRAPAGQRDLRYSLGAVAAGRTRGPRLSPGVRGSPRPSPARLPRFTTYSWRTEQAAQRPYIRRVFRIPHSMGE